jgi:hypothetical protein
MPVLRKEVQEGGAYVIEAVFHPANSSKSSQTLV